MFECDLHLYKYTEAIELIIQSLRTCWKSHVPAIRIIHGYHGHILKDYIGSPKFLTDMAAEGFF
jgi:DNA-nicking Smr family endonuclease